MHDHGFNTISTYGNLRRLMREGRIGHNAWEMEYYELAIKASACTQAARWSNAADGLGYVYSFNGPHSLFIDTMRTLRVLGLAHQLGHIFMGENDIKISLLSRLLSHGLITARYNIYYGQGRDHYDTSDLRATACTRIHIQYQRWPLSVSEQPTGLFTILHLDARVGLGHVGLCRAIGISKDSDD